MSSDLFYAFKQNLQTLNVTNDERVLVAVSGGADSMALLHLFLRWNKENVGIFHLNHRFREDGVVDAKFVADFAQKRGIPAYILDYDVNAYLKESGQSKQQGARTIRYHLLEKCARENGYKRIALAHHGDDQAETVLMRLLRGSGLPGLAGIPSKRGVFIRPILDVYKEEIIDYCRAFAVPYREDETNFSPIYLRNKLRQELIPLLKEEYNPEIVSQLVQLADLIKEDNLELEKRAKGICQNYSYRQHQQVIFPREVFQELSISLQRRVLRQLIKQQQGHLRRISFVHIETWRTELKENTTFQLSLPNLVVSATQENIFVGEFSSNAWTRTILTVPGQQKLADFTITAQVFSRAELPPRTNADEDFALDDLVLPLEIRPREAGDRLKLMGQVGSKKVKSLFIDAHIPVEQRDYLPLISDQQNILWIPTIRRGSVALIHEHTKHVLRLNFKTNDA